MTTIFKFDAEQVVELVGQELVRNGFIEIGDEVDAVFSMRRGEFLLEVATNVDRDNSKETKR